jgi:integrase
MLARVADRTGIRVRHQRGCASRGGADCDCKPRYQAQVFDARSGRQIWRTARTLTEARQWRQDAAVAVRAGTLHASDGRTLRAVADEWLAGARSGVIRNRSGDPYKPSAVRGYEATLRLRVFPALGSAKFTAVRRVDLQDLVDKLHAAGLAASTVQCSILPLRAMYRRALARGEVAINPTTGLELPAIRGRRDRIVSPAQAAKLLAALPETDRPLWATALYAGLRRGELMALRWEDVDLEAGVIRVRRGWDTIEGEIAPKSAKGNRTVPVAAILRDCLANHWLRGGEGALVFGDGGKPFRVDALAKRAKAAWSAASLEPITLHECRHTAASFAIAAGVNAKALSTYMGHANVATTYDLYGHLMPGNEAEAVTLLDAFLAAGDTERGET